MGFKRSLNAVDTHSGIPMRVITGGLPNIPGANVREKMHWLQQHDDGLRKLLLREPRGYPAHCCNILVPPGHPEADAGYIILEQVEYPMMSGGNTISVVTSFTGNGYLAHARAGNRINPGSARRIDTDKSRVSKRQSKKRNV